MKNDTDIFAVAQDTSTTNDILDAFDRLVTAAISDMDLSAVISFSQNGVYPAGSLGAHNKISVSVTDAPFLAVAGGPDCSAAIQSAINFVRALGGGEVIIPRGNYKCSSAGLTIAPIAGVGWNNVKLSGAGSGGTVLDFSGSPASTDSLSVTGWGGRVYLEGFSLINSKAVGINTNPVNRGSANFISRICYRDLIVDNSALDGLRFTQTYMCSLSDIESRNNQGYGFNLRGSHTSIFASRCWAGGDAPYPNGGNMSGGWNLNGLVYSAFTACAADNSGGPGWTIKAVAGVVLTGCGSEANLGTGFLAISDDNNIDSIPTPGINNLLLDGCFAIGNGAVATPTPNFIEIQTGGARPGSIALRGCYDILSGGKLVSTALVGSGGLLTLEESSCTFQGTRSKSGSTYVKNLSCIGKTSIVKLGANSSIPDSVSTVVPFSSFDSNYLGSTLVATGKTIIPTGVNRVRVSLGIFWDTNSTGPRTVSILKNGSSVFGLPSSKTLASGFTTQQISSAIIEVVAGDEITAIVTQASGVALNVIANSNTYLSVEAMG